jgi:hypothetical protein
MRSATETVKNREEGMRDGSSLRSAYNNALLGLSKPPAMPVVLTFMELLFNLLKKNFLRLLEKLALLVYLNYFHKTMIPEK